jgi:4-aminobutyrate aminotransferase-like enzyme
MFASEWLDGGVKPDILVCAKGIANGFPLSAIATRSDLACKQPPGSMGGMYCVQDYYKISLIKCTSVQSLYYAALYDLLQELMELVLSVVLLVWQC